MREERGDALQPVPPARTPEYICEQMVNAPVLEENVEVVKQSTAEQIVDMAVPQPREKWGGDPGDRADDGPGPLHLQCLTALATAHSGANRGHGSSTVSERIW